MSIFEPPGGWTVYNSYVTDPWYQRYFTAAWGGVLGVAVLASLPRIVRYNFIHRRWREGWLLSQTDYAAYSPLVGDEKGTLRGETPARTRQRGVLSDASVRLCSLATKALGWAVPWVGLLTGQILLLLIGLGFVFACIFPESQLSTNPNRLGFIDLALIPPLFLLAMKHSPLVALVGQSYEKVNFIHRWIGRLIFILGLAHGGTWIRSWQASGQVAQMMAMDKAQRGLLTLCFAALLFVSGGAWLRRTCYPLFFGLHVVGFVGFIVAVDRHTPYARNWVGWGAVLLYGIDIALRLLRYRFAEATVEALPGGSIKIWIEDYTRGWRSVASSLCSG
jgi:ferric-chelate reductase